MKRDALCTDGLIIRLVGFKDELVPWSDLAEASVRPQPAKKPQIARLRFANKSKTIDVGGIYNVFPTPAHVERFVRQVNERIYLAREPPASGPD